MSLTIDNYIDAKFVRPSSGNYLSVENPANGDTIGTVGVSGAKDVDTAVAAAETAFHTWSKSTIKARAAIMMKFHSLVEYHADELADLIVLENGKNKTEALADGKTWKAISFVTFLVLDSLFFLFFSFNEILQWPREMKQSSMPVRCRSWRKEMS
jgi:acyl-CoA reductase-like NAD-dependent aldehyde dehydrogenase